MMSLSHDASTSSLNNTFLRFLDPACLVGRRSLGTVGHCVRELSDIEAPVNGSFLLAGWVRGRLHHCQKTARRTRVQPLPEGPLCMWSQLPGLSLRSVHRTHAVVRDAWRRLLHTL
jgi:hypothetical protein